MKKILLAFDNHHMPEDGFEFIARLNEVNPVLLIGVFLREINYAINPRPTYFEGLGLPAYEHPVETVSPAEIAVKIKWFEEKCIRNNIEFRVHNDTDDLIIHELKKETRFADLLVVTESFYQSDEKDLSPLLQTILHLSECPVLAISGKGFFPENIVFAYDGSESAAHAIKQFAYVFPEFSDKSLMVVYGSKNGDDNMPDAIFIEEFTARHFSDVSFLKLEGDTSRLSLWASERQGALLVTGSFGRSVLSETLRKSFVYDIVREHRLPVFIAHK